MKITIKGNRLISTALTNLIEEIRKCNEAIKQDEELTTAEMMSEMVRIGVLLQLAGAMTDVVLATRE